MNALPDYRSIVAFCEACLDRHGDNHQGVGWPKGEHIDARHQVMLDVIRVGAARPVRLLDFGCGASHLLEYIHRQGIKDVEYAGVDLSERFIALSRRKFPDTQYWCIDVLQPEIEVLPRFDYVVINGIFTCKLELSFEEMWSYFTQVITRLFGLADVGIAFNVMSKYVDWERDDLFHVPFDQLARWLFANLSRHFTFRHDYGPYEYTTHLYHEPVVSAGPRFSRSDSPGSDRQSLEGK